MPCHIVSSQTRYSAIEMALFSYAISFCRCEVIDKLSHLNHTVSLLQYVAQSVALLDVYDDTFISIHNIVTNII